MLKKLVALEAVLTEGTSMLDVLALLTQQRGIRRENIRKQRIYGQAREAMS